MGDATYGRADGGTGKGQHSTTQISGLLLSGIFAAQNISGSTFLFTANVPKGESSWDRG